MATALLSAVTVVREPLLAAVASSVGTVGPSSAPPRRAQQEQAQSSSDKVDEGGWDTNTFELTFEFAVSLSVVSAFVIVFLIVGSVVVRRAGRPHTGRRSRQDGKRQVDAAEIERRFPGTTVDDEPTCAVCLLQVELDELCRVTDCGHAFHADCILQWWTHKPRSVLRCPECRQKQRRHASPDTRQNGHERRLRRQQLDFREWDDKETPVPFKPYHRRLTPPKHGLFPLDLPRTLPLNLPQMVEAEEDVAPGEEDLKAKEKDRKAEEREEEVQGEEGSGENKEGEEEEQEVPEQEEGEDEQEEIDEEEELPAPRTLRVRGTTGEDLGAFPVLLQPLVASNLLEEIDEEEELIAPRILRVRRTTGEELADFPSPLQPLASNMLAEV